GITPASEFFVALTITMTFMCFSLGCRPDSRAETPFSGPDNTSNSGPGNRHVPKQFFPGVYKIKKITVSAGEIRRPPLRKQPGSPGTRAPAHAKGGPTFSRPGFS